MAGLMKPVLTASTAIPTGEGMRYRFHCKATP